MSEKQFEKITGGIWSPIFTLARNEKKVFATLRADGVPVYLPLRRHINLQPVISKGKNYCYKRVLHVPMFSNYLFANINFDVRQKLIKDRSVIHILDVNEYQEEKLINELNMIQELELYSEKEEIFVQNEFQVGQKVILTEGIFAGWEGILCSIEKEDFVFINITTINASVQIKYPKQWCKVI